MIDGSEKRNCQLAFELQNSLVCEKRSRLSFLDSNFSLTLSYLNQVLDNLALNMKSNACFFLFNKL